MGLHIDLIENDWSAGEQRVVASLGITAGTPDLRSHDILKWGGVLQLQQLPKPIPAERVEEILKGLAARFQGDYLFATEPHDAEDCPYPPVARLQRPGRPVPYVRKAAGVP